MKSPDQSTAYREIFSDIEHKAFHSISHIQILFHAPVDIEELEERIPQRFARNTRRFPAHGKKGN